MIISRRRLEDEERARERVLAKERSVKEQRRREREERRRRRKMQHLQDLDEDDDTKIAVEERKLLIAQRKLESIRILDELLERVKVMMMKFTAGLKSVSHSLLLILLGLNFFSIFQG